MTEIERRALRAETDEILVEARELQKLFPVRRGVLRRHVADVHAVDGVDLEVRRGEALALVGESGSGKSTLGRVLLRLLEPTGGTVRFAGQDVTSVSRSESRALRRRMQIVFQDPYASLDPRMVVGAAIREPLDVHSIGDAASRDARVLELADMVGLDAILLERLPHELSGGQRQRVGIARALASDPEFIVADEAIASLDVSIQAQIVNLLADLQDRLGLTYLFITHDLGMAHHLCDRIAVLYLGKVMEIGDARDLTRTPMHPYTAALLSAVPVADPEQPWSRPVRAEGEVPSAVDPPPGCRFSTRCPFATDRCRDEVPELRTLGSRSVACHHAETLTLEGAARTAHDAEDAPTDPGES